MANKHAGLGPPFKDSAGVLGACTSDADAGNPGSDAQGKGDGGEEPDWGQMRVFFYMHKMPSEVHWRCALPPTPHTVYGPRSAPIYRSAHTCMHSRLLKH